MSKQRKEFTATRNACKVCAPLGAGMVFKGIEGAVPLLHGSQGCATYVRRYIISHFKEPVDIASSSFAESAAIFGGKENLQQALDNVIRQYDPRLIGVATTCLSETIGDDVPGILKEYRAARKGKELPLIIPVSSPSYAGTHMDGFHEAVKAVASGLATRTVRRRNLNVFPGFVSPADIRYLKEILNNFGLLFTVLPDYSQTLDSPHGEGYRRIPAGGTPLREIIAMGESFASVEFGGAIASTETAAELLRQRFGVPRRNFCLPVGIRQTDLFFDFLKEYSGRPVPLKYREERGRLVDSYIDAHKYVFGKKAVLYGEEDLVAGMASFLAEIGVVPALCASGGESGRFRESLERAVPGLAAGTAVREGADFMEIAGEAVSLRPDIIVGNSKGYPLARQLKIPLVRVGFPVHDRIGGQRLLHLGYRGAQELFDRVVNALIERRQDDSPAGYMYM